MRIVAGKWAGRQLTSPGGRTRPTAEAVRSAWMTLLEPRFRETRVLDLFAGTGALGLEALSRGARRADFVENGPPALHALKANIAALRVRDCVRVFKRDAIPFAEAAEPGAYSVAFADPPYASRMVDRLVEIWKETGFSEVLAVEHAADQEVPAGGRRFAFNDTAVTIYPAAAVAALPAPAVPAPRAPRPVHARRNRSPRRRR
jgi:16S rRNA (guanine966-N2)-methyltransferase